MSSTPTPSYSGVNTANKVTYAPFFNMSGYHYATSTLVDILSKREHLYRTFLRSKASTVVIPEFFTTSINSKLLAEVKSLFLYIDPITFRAELQRELLFQKSMLTQHDMKGQFLKFFSNVSYTVPVNLQLINSFLTYYISIPSDNMYSDGFLKENLFKSQYKPMRKGITNMIRLQATSAIAMPTEMRLHILASSKDVIHS
jgi:hypothetical protein